MAIATSLKYTPTLPKSSASSFVQLLYIPVFLSSVAEFKQRTILSHTYSSPLLFLTLSSFSMVQSFKAFTSFRSLFLLLQFSF